MGLLYWIVVGLIAGWLAGKVMRGGGYGVVIDIVLGILGGIVDGWGVWDARHLARWRHSWLDHRRVCWRGDSGVDHATGEKGLAKKLNRGPKAKRSPVGQSPLPSEKASEMCRSLGA